MMRVYLCSLGWKITVVLFNTKIKLASAHNLGSVCMY